MTLCWIFTFTHKHHISIQYPSHKYLPERSCLDCLWILIMFWLFKNPVVSMKEIMSWIEIHSKSGLTQFQPLSNQTVKNGLKRSNCPKWNFSRKITNKTFMYLSANFILQNLFKNLTVDLELWGCAIFSAQNGPFAPQKTFFGKYYWYHFDLPIGSFHYAKF